MSKITELKYSEKAMNAMKHSIINDWKLGETCEYQINIDSIPIVRRTGDIELFDYYKEVLYEEAEQIEVWVFPNKTSLYIHKYIFLNPHDPEKSTNLLKDKEYKINELEKQLRLQKLENTKLSKLFSDFISEIAKHTKNQQDKQSLKLLALVVNQIKMT